MKCFFDPDLMGALPDVRIPDASVEDWQAALDLVTAGWTPAIPPLPGLWPPAATTTWTW
ncbi:hypothetical protein [Streptomyces syringium]|uniref:hypothetical protein n=1 Tax=Streptomyces syringium TaxID=76729 RepID=UPI0033B816C2